MQQEQHNCSLKKAIFLEYIDILFAHTVIVFVRGVALNEE